MNPSKQYNKDHDYDMDEKSIRERIDAWNKTQNYESKINETLQKNSEKFFQNEKDFEKWKNSNPSIKKFNRARDRMISGLVQFMDGFADLKEESGDWITEPDFLNMIFMTAFSRSQFYEKTTHWAKAEQEFQQNRNTSLPGGLSGNGQETIKRKSDLVWHSLQFLYRQFEFTRFVPAYEIVEGMWNLENELNETCVPIIDRWYYIHKEQIQKKKDMTDFTKGYFFRYNAKMTSDAQAQTLYVLNNLYRYSMSKPVGTFEYPPWFRDSVITGNGDGNLPYSKNVIPHKIDKEKIQKINKSSILSEEIAGMKTLPTDCEDPKEFEDKKLAEKIISKKYSDIEELKFDIRKTEKSREENGYTPDEGEWDQDVSQKFDIDGFRIYVEGGKITKIKDCNGEKHTKVKVKGKRYKLGATL